MSEAFPLLVAFFGAAVGAYFAVLKSKKERLWTEQFEALKEISTAANTIVHSHDQAHMEEMGIRVMGEKEKELLVEDVLREKANLRNALAKLQLLFPEQETKTIQEAYIDMNASISDTFNAFHQGDFAGEVETVATKARKLLDETIKIARGKYL